MHLALCALVCIHRPSSSLCNKQPTLHLQMYLVAPQFPFINYSMCCRAYHEIESAIKRRRLGLQHLSFDQCMAPRLYGASLFVNLTGAQAAGGAGEVAHEGGALQWAEARCGHGGGRVRHRPPSEYTSAVAMCVGIGGSAVPGCRPRREENCFVGGRGGHGTEAHLPNPPLPLLGRGAGSGVWAVIAHIRFSFKLEDVTPHGKRLGHCGVTPASSCLLGG